MTTQFGNAKIRIELDPREAEEALARLIAKVQGLDKSLAGAPEGAQPSAGAQPQSGDAKARRASGDSASSADSGPPTMRSTGPGKFGVQNVRGLLSGPGLLGAVPLVGGTLKFASEIQQKYGALAEGLAEGIANETIRGAGLEDSTSGNIIKSLMKAAIAAQETVRQTIQTLDSKLRAVEPAIEAVLSIGKAQLLAAGGLDKNFLSQYSLNIYDIQSTLIRKDKDIRDKTLKEVGEAGGAEIIKTLLDIAKR